MRCGTVRHSNNRIHGLTFVDFILFVLDICIIYLVVSAGANQQIFNYIIELVRKFQYTQAAAAAAAAAAATIRKTIATKNE